MWGILAELSLTIFRRKNPQVKQVDMLHAADYGQMTFKELKHALVVSKNKDRTLNKNIM